VFQQVPQTQTALQVVADDNIHWFKHGIVSSLQRLTQQATTVEIHCVCRLL